MKIRRSIVALILAVMLLLPLMPEATVKAEETKEIDIMFTHDLHSHLENFTIVENGENTKYGGMACMKTLIDAQKAKNPNTLLLDGGDFSMGTLLQTVYETKAAELRVLGSLGCDVTTLGNHEYDYRSKGLSNMLTAAVQSKDTLPAMVVCNVDWEAMEAAGLSEGQKLIWDAFALYGVKDYVVVQKGNVSIAVLGLFGKDALACAPTCELIFKDPVEAAKATVEKIKEQEQVDMIVCVSHSGTWADENKSEDEILAKAVPDIDVIISGHTHSKLEAPIVHGNTHIVSSGEYGKYMGSFHMERTENGRWEMKAYDLLEVSADLKEEETIKEKIDSLKQTVDTDYLSRWNYTTDQVIVQNDVAFSSVRDIEFEHTDHNLGNIIADSYKYAVEHAPDFDGVEVAVAIAPSGTIRESYPIGDVTVADIFNSFSLGIGEDGVPGYPLLSVYLTGAELKLVAEIDASVSDLMTTARLYNAGMYFTFNPHRMLLNRVTDCYLVNNRGEREEIVDDKLYRVVSDLYSGQMLGGVTSLSYGLISLELKNADGTPIESLSDAIVYINGNELKAWTAIAQYMDSFEDTDSDGISNMPSYYEGQQGRKTVSDSKNVMELVKNPNKYTAMILGVGVVALALVVLVIVCIKKVLSLVIRKVRNRK